MRNIFIIFRLIASLSISLFILIYISYTCNRLYIKSNLLLAAALEMDYINENSLTKVYNICNTLCPDTNSSYDNIFDDICLIILLTIMLVRLYRYNRIL